MLDDVHRADPAFDTLLTDCLKQLRDLPLILLSTGAAGATGPHVPVGRY